MCKDVCDDGIGRYANHPPCCLLTYSCIQFFFGKYLKKFSIECQTPTPLHICVEAILSVKAHGHKYF